MTVNEALRAMAGIVILISLALAVGGVCRGLDQDGVRALGEAGHWLGLAFQ